MPFVSALVAVAAWDLKSSSLCMITNNLDPLKVCCAEREVYGFTHLHLHLDFVDEQMDV